MLETCVKNCGHRFHVLLAKKEFLDELVKILNPKVGVAQNHSLCIQWNNFICMYSPLLNRPFPSCFELFHNKNNNNNL